MRRGYTLIEVFITVIVCAVLAAVAIPIFDKSVQKQQENRAVLNLRAIALAEKIYRAKNGIYACTACSDPASIESFLGVRISDAVYAYSVTATTTTFTATINRSSSPAHSISLNQAGTFTLVSGTPPVSVATLNAGT